jgi:hypothetical protein
VQTGLQDLRETAVDPHERALVVLEVENRRFVAERTNLAENVEVGVRNERLAHGEAIDAATQPRARHGVPARAEGPDELPVLEEEPALVGADLDDVEHHGFSFLSCPLFFL